MGLRHLVRGRTVLEIGCNAGFISISLADVAERILAFDINPHLVELGRMTAQHLGITNIEFCVSAFEDLAVEPFDAVLSFANHSTYDDNTRHSIEEYISRCWQMTAPGGLFLFESHPPAHEGDGLEEVCRLVANQFRVEECRVLNYGRFLDSGRTFSVGRRPLGATAVPS